MRILQTLRKNFFIGSFESNKELDCDTANICPTLDSMQVPTGDNDQSNFEDTV